MRPAAAPRPRWQAFAWIAAITMAATLAATSSTATELLHIGAVPTQPCEEDTPETRPLLTLRRVQTSGDRAVDLDAADLPPGWRKSVDEERVYLEQIRDCAQPLSIPVDGDWVQVSVAPGPLPAVVKLGAQERWLDATQLGSSARTVELGATTPKANWKRPRAVASRRSLTSANGIVETDQGRHVLKFDELHALDPYPGLRATTLELPATLTFPDLPVPRDAKLRFALVGPTNGELRATAEVVFPNSRPVTRSETYPLGHELSAHTLELATTSSGPATLRLHLESLKGHGDSTTLVDPEILGTEEVGPPRNELPNVILVTLDTVRADHMSLYGYHRPTTPFLDGVADELLVFENAYSQVPSTRPSHFSILTSRYPRDLGLWANSDPPLPQSELSVAEIFQAAGWRTGAVLSVRFLAADGGASQGFDEMLLPPRSPQAQLGKHTTDRALDFIRRHQNTPFFLWVHYFDAHLPYQPVPELRELFWRGPPPTEEDIDADLLEKSGFGTLHAVPHREYMTAMYDASLRYLDDQLRELFSFLGDRGLLEATVVAIGADHGESLGEHGVYFAHDGLYEPNVRVPLIFRLPGGTPRGRVEAVVENIGIAPTLLSAAGLETPAPFRGSTLLVRSPGNNSAYFEQGEWFSGLRLGSKKWIDGRGFAAESKFADSSLRLLHNGAAVSFFDLEKDPTEKRNLATDRPDQASKLEQLFAGFAAAHTDESKPKDEREIDPEIRERLRSLGYTE